MSKAISSRPPGAEPSLGVEWADAVHPVVVADRTGVVVMSNAAGRRWFPDVAEGTHLADVVPGWLADAHRRLTTPAPASQPARTEPVSGYVGERSFEALPSRLRSGDVMWLLVDDTDRRRAAEVVAAERDRLAILVETFDTLSPSLNLDRSTEMTARLAARHLADAAVVIAWTADGALTVTSGRSDGATARCTVGADTLKLPGLEEALRGYPPLPSHRVDPAAIPTWLVPPELSGALGSASVIPLPGHGLSAGAMLLLRRRGAATTIDGDERLLGPFAARAGAALAAARMYAEQVRITTALMRDLLPPRLPDVDGVEFAGGYRAAYDGERVSGDFYDVHLGTDTDELLVVLGDVCGKGLEAAALTGKIRNTLHALLPMAADHHLVLDLLNRTLVDSHHTQFATLVLGTVSRSGHRVRLRLTCAGHPAPLILRADGRVEEVDTQGSLIGVLPSVHATTATVELLPGETCFLFTDGLTEARGGPMGSDMFGEQRLRTALAECAGLAAGAIVEHVQMLVSDWVGDRSRDDMALIAITAPMSSSSARHDGTRAW